MAYYDFLRVLRNYEYEKKWKAEQRKKNRKRKPRSRVSKNRK